MKQSWQHWSLQSLQSEGSVFYSNFGIARGRYKIQHINVEQIENRFKIIIDTAIERATYNFLYKKCIDFYIKMITYFNEKKLFN